ncbi:DUF2512 family protein [Halobacillus karajensis]|uniref:DUF2512 family protein n=1 Tax=Halobacillus karajensis TaxID=195088 RepID=UPI0009F1AD15
MRRFIRISLTDILITSILLTGAGFIVGDLFILAKFGNGAATITEFGLVSAGIWISGSYLFDPPISFGTASLITALVIIVIIVITMGEIFFHRYMEKQILHGHVPSTKHRKVSSPKRNLQTIWIRYRDQTSCQKG